MVRSALCARLEPWAHAAILRDGANALLQRSRTMRPRYAVFSIGGADGRISANATWMMPPARPSATPIRQAIV